MVRPAIVIPSTPDAPGPTPRRPDGSLYRYELIDAMGQWRAYADEPEALVGVLITDYAELDDVARLAARISLAVHVRTMAQAHIIAAAGLAGCTADDIEVLRHDGQMPPVTHWSAPVPLLLVEGFYQPIGDLPRPVAAGAGEIIWIDPREDRDLLRSLHYLGWTILAELAEQR
ncbi:hypothetical protein [Catellatospora citrea]|uniref:Uncharacterized protein n=1 Tax=Catellatospora citrea TaxID=53366 RepID=A0A8J3KH86_9ACTN|nr:hypothetical protein [Catellatospora citrea]RKE10673.1 hypothetical protein C8E86_5589 [Catellatospora citrea]GIG03147.1 hypothetical protein Cci01nite_82400 [Catellatospora citrea]